MNGICELCGIEYPYLQRDHKLAKAFGGTDDAENIQFICPNCHHLKSQEERQRWAVENKEKLRSVWLGKKQSPESNAKRSLALKGRAKTAAHRTAAAEGTQRWWDQRRVS